MPAAAGVRAAAQAAPPGWRVGAQAAAGGPRRAWAYTPAMKLETSLVQDVTAAGLRVVVDSVRAAVAARGRAVLALSGGSTPLPLYRALADQDLPWERVWVAFGDERFVPLEHPDSNAGAALAAFLDRVPVPEEQVLTWPILEGDPHASAEAYRGKLEGALHGFPTFDLNLLGLGDDGHTASLFPGTGAVLQPGPTLALRAPDYAWPGGWRLSLSAPALSDSRTVLFLVSGASKARALREAFASDTASEPPTSAELDACPARAITARERLLLVTDVAF